jgi:hypothetical protein
MPLPTRLIFDRIFSESYALEWRVHAAAGSRGSPFVRGLKSAPQTRLIPHVHKSLDQIVRLRVRVRRRRE